jgi:hypothetical protein
LPIPFFSGFYKGLTGNPFSLFDALCLSAAVIDKALGSITEDRVAAMAGGSDPVLSWRARMKLFMLLGCITDPISAFDNAATPKQTTLSTVLNLVPTLGAIACGLPRRTETESPDMLEDLIVTGVLGAVAVVLASSSSARGAVKNAAGDVALVGTLIYRSVKILSGPDGTAGVFSALGLVKSTLAGGVRIIVGVRKTGIPHVPAAIYAAAQGTLSGARLGLIMA